MTNNTVYLGDNLNVIASLPDESIDMIYMDPPFNTGILRKNTAGSYTDWYDDYVSFLSSRLELLKMKMKEEATIWIHLDYRESHYAKVLCDKIFGRENFVNEIIWSYDYGGRGKRCFPKKHDNILVYSKNPKKYYFDWNSVPRVPYMAPGLAGKVKAAKGKAITDVWWHTIVPTSGKERVNYPTQKPVGLIKRAIAVCCPPGGVVLDAFAGSGSTAAAADICKRNWIMIDESKDAWKTMQSRFLGRNDISWVNTVNILENQIEEEQ